MDALVGPVASFGALTILLLFVGVAVGGVVFREYVLRSPSEPFPRNAKDFVLCVRRYCRDYRRYLKIAVEAQAKNGHSESPSAPQPNLLNCLTRAVQSFVDLNVMVPAVACTVMRAVLQVSTPVLDGRILDLASEALAGKSVNRALQVLCGIRLGFAFLNWIAHTLHGILFARVNHYMTKRLREITFRKIVSQDTEYLGSTVKSGELQSILVSDCGELVSQVTYAIEEVSATVFGLVIGGFVSVRLDWRLTLLSLLIMLPSFIIVVPRASTLVTTYHTYYNECNRKVSALSAELTSARAAKTIQLKNAIEHETERYKQTGCLFIDSMKHFNLAETALIYAGDFTLWTMGAALLIGGSSQIAAGKIDVGHYVAFRGVVGMLNEAIRNIGSIRLRLAKFLPVAHRVFGLLDRSSPQLQISAASERHGRRVRVDGHVQFKAVKFSYRRANSSEAIFSLGPIDLEVRPGQKLALVGPSGGGKSTILSLLLRVHESTEGSILIDGKDIRDYPLRDVRDIFGYIEQDPCLLNRSVAENIALGFPDATMESVEEAAKVAHAHSFIESLPDGYQTIAGENGSALSGGQKQRIAIARAIFGAPDILLLDEATSALDTTVESHIQVALAAAMRKKTSIVVAHRLSTIENADVIAVVTNGRIVETGTHTELSSRKDGHYSQLISTKTKWQHQGHGAR